MDVQPTRANSLEMRTSCEEGYLTSLPLSAGSLDEHRPIVAPDTAKTRDGNMM
jgi:hypothetical protein